MNADFQKIKDKRREILEQIDKLMDEGFQKSIEYRRALTSGDEQTILRLRDEKDRINNALRSRRNMLEEIDNAVLLSKPPIKAGSLVDLRTNGLGTHYTIYLHDQPTNIGRIEYRDYHCSEYLGDIGYVIDEEYRNCGYATEALALLSEKLYEDGVPDFWVTVYEDNITSKRVIEKNGGEILKRKSDICLYVVPTKMRNLEPPMDHRPK